jgi:hypothetical protein
VIDLHGSEEIDDDLDRYRDNSDGNKNKEHEHKNYKDSVNSEEEANPRLD